MVQGVSFNVQTQYTSKVANAGCNPCTGCGACGKQCVENSAGNSPNDFLDKLKQAGIPANIVSQGKNAVETYAKANNITLPDPPKPPAPPAGKKSQGAAHSNENSALNTVTSESIKTIMEKNNIVSTGVLKDDIAAIKSTLGALGKDDAKVLSDKLKEAGLILVKPDTDVKPKDAFKGSAQLASMNKHFLLNKKAV